jgi:hypothetical protein
VMATAVRRAIGTTMFVEIYCLTLGIYNECWAVKDTICESHCRKRAATDSIISSVPFYHDSSTCQKC